MSIAASATPALGAPSPAETPPARRLFAAAMLAGPALLTLVLVLHHPVVRRQDGTADLAAGVAEIATANRVVHGTLFVLLAMQAIGYYLFSDRLGWRRPAVAVGFLAHAAGVLLLGVPLLLDGFVAVDLAAACRRAAEGCGPAGGAALRLVAVTIQVFTKAGLVVTSGAIAAWSLALLTTTTGPGTPETRASTGAPRRDGIARGAGVVGLVCAAVPVVLLGVGGYLRPSTLAGPVAAQVVWALLAAAIMSRAAPPVGRA
jgi:hypothetical protein